MKSPGPPSPPARSSMITHMITLSNLLGDLMPGESIEEARGVAEMLERELRAVLGKPVR